MKKLYSLFAVAALAMTATAQQTVFYADFDDVTGTGGNDGLFSGGAASNAIPTYTTGGNWVLANAYKADKALKMGTGSKLGAITTPALTFTGNAVLTFRAGAWDGNNEKTTLKVSATGATLDLTEVTLVKGAFSTYTINISNATDGSTIKFEGEQANNARFFIDDIKVETATQAAANFNTAKVNLVKSTVVSNEIIFGEEAKVSVINMAGQVVKTADVKDNSRLDVTSLAKGTYIVTATVNGKTVSQKIIKK